LGLAGMPRRIPDYADAYSSWNELSSLGSIISVFATFIFGIVLYRSFVSEQTNAYSNWSLTSFWALASVDSSAIKAYPETQEWLVRSPVPHHSYDNLTIE
jgi:cytochrome c oxidase subunit 1